MLTLLKSSLTWIVICACLLFAPFVHAQTEDLDPGYTFVKEAGLVQDLNLSQTQGDLTATVESFYADENRIIVAYNLAAPDDTAPRNYLVQLTDSLNGIFEPYPDYGGTQPSRGSLVTSFRVGDRYMTMGEEFIFSILLSDGVSFDFNIEAEVHFAERVFWDMRSDAAAINMHLYLMSVSPSMTVTTFCFIPPTNATWLPQGRFTNEVMTMPLRSFYSFLLVEDEPCVDVYAYIPYEFDGNPAPMSMTIDRLATPRLQTLENMRNLQTRAEDLGVTVEIVNTGDPTDYEYTVSNPTPEFELLVNDLLYEHIDGPWLFQLGGMP